MYRHALQDRTNLAFAALQLNRDLGFSEYVYGLVRCGLRLLLSCLSLCTCKCCMLESQVLYTDHRHAACAQGSSIFFVTYASAQVRSCHMLHFVAHSRTSGTVFLCTVQLHVRHRGHVMLSDCRCPAT